MTDQLTALVAPNGVPSVDTPMIAGGALAQALLLRNLAPVAVDVFVGGQANPATHRLGAIGDVAAIRYIRLIPADAVSVIAVEGIGGTGTVLIEASTDPQDASPIPVATPIAVAQPSDMQMAVLDVVGPATPTLIDADFFIDVQTAGGLTTINLPTAVGRRGRTYLITDVDGAALTFPITIDPAGAETVNGAPTLVIAVNRGSALIHSDGANWSSP